MNVVMFVHDYRVKPPSFFHLSRPAQGPSNLLVSGLQGSLPRVKWLGQDLNMHLHLVLILRMSGAVLFLFTPIFQML